MHVRTARTIWKKLRSLYKSGSETAVDVKLTQLQHIGLANKSYVIEYTNRPQRVVNGFLDVRQNIWEAEECHALL